MTTMTDHPARADCTACRAATPVDRRGSSAHGLTGWIAVVAAAMVMACSTAAPTLRLHSLVGSQASFSPAGATAMAGPPAHLVIAPIQVPAAIDQPQWLVRRADDSLQMLEQDRWAAPLADELKAALRARLSSRWNVVDGALPASQSTVPQGAAWRLVLEVLRMDARPAIDIQLEVRWSLLAPLARSANVACSLRIVEAVRGQGSLPIADAYRSAVQQLADQIGAQLRASPDSGVQACGPAGPTG